MSRRLTIGFGALLLSLSALPGRAAEKAHWVEQAGERPTEQRILDLRTAAAEKPRDRVVRNQLCYALDQREEWGALATAAEDWLRYDARNPQVYEYLGTALTANGRRARALRAFSSLADVAPKDSGIQNRAGYLALRAGEAELAAELFREALVVRPDHHNNYRGLAHALWEQGRHADALSTLAEAMEQDFHPRYGDVRRILREEAATIAAAWMKAAPDREPEIFDRAAALELDPDYHDALRVTLHWETDANDVDLHIVDPVGEECYYSHKRNASGLHLYADLTQGLGPEVMVVPPGKLLAGRYHVGVKYYNAGPMGTARGIVLIQRPSRDGSPDVRIETFTLLPDLEGKIQDMRHVAVLDIDEGDADATAPPPPAVGVGATEPVTRAAPLPTVLPTPVPSSP